MEQATYRLLRSTNSFRRDLKLFHSVYGHQHIPIDSVMHPRSSRVAQYKCLSYSYSYSGELFTLLTILHSNWSDVEG